MRIGIYDPYLDTLSGGEKYMLTAASCLARNNEVNIFWDDESILDSANEKLSIDLSKTKITPNIFSSRTTLTGRIPKTLAYDLIFILSDGSIPLTLSSRTILHFQTPVEWIKGDDLKTKIKLHKINKVICNSFFTKEYIDKKLHVDSLVIYPPCISSGQIINLNTQKKQINKKNIILNVGRFNPLPSGSSSKKQEEMINIFKKMYDGGLRNWEFNLAVSYRQESKQHIDKLQKMIENYPVKIYKNCSYQELEKLYLDAKIYWHAAGLGENLTQYPERAEHFGITTVEAMARGAVPVVISAGGQPEIVDDNINGFLWETEEELIRKTKKIINDDKLRIQMSELSLKKSSQFTTERFCAQIQTLLK